MKTERLEVEGMSCGHCSAMVKKSLSMVKGVSSADVQTGLAVIEYDEEVTGIDELEAAITRFGYKIKQ